MEKCRADTYEAEVSFFRDIRLRFNEDNACSTAHTPRDDFIFYEKDIKAVLLKHWNVYNSLLHSRLLVSKLGLWRERGRQKLETMLAKMG